MVLGWLHTMAQRDTQSRARLRARSRYRRVWASLNVRREVTGGSLRHDFQVICLECCSVAWKPPEIVVTEAITDRTGDELHHRIRRYNRSTSNCARAFIVISYRG